MRILITLCLTLSLSSFAQKKESFKEECISGNCKTGKGVLKTALYTYEVGTFVKGKLQGEGIHLEFFAPGAYNGYTSREADFVLQAGMQEMSPKDALNFKPLNYRMGVFQKGELQGEGKEQISSIALLKKKFKGALDEQLLIVNNNRYGVYEGEFKDNELTGRGSLSIDGDLFTIYYHPEQFERIFNNQSGLYEIYDKQYKRKGYFNGIIKGGYRIGWFTTNVKQVKPVYGTAQFHHELLLDSGYYRALYFENELIGRTTVGVYPLDEAGTAKHDLGNGIIYYGPVNASNQPDGFGMLTRTFVNNKKQTVRDYTYTGYFNNGKREGLGEQIKFWEEKPSSWYCGNYIGDTLRSGQYYFAGALNYERPDYKKGGGLHPYTTFQYKKGTFNSQGLLVGYGIKGSFRKYHNEDKNYDEIIYKGYFNEREEYHGEGEYVDKMKRNEKKGTFYYGNLRTGSNRYRADGLWPGCIVESNGKKVYVVGKNYKTGAMELSDGSTAAGDYQILGYNGDGFKCGCSSCGGDGKTSVRVNVPVTTHSWTRDVQTSKEVPYLNARWEGITKVTTGYTTGGYSYSTPRSCSVCNGNGWVYCRKTLPLE